ncbi:unnamed protein product, partial [Urochloa humidicola]
PRAASLNSPHTQTHTARPRGAPPRQRSLTAAGVRGSPPAGDAGMVAWWRRKVVPRARRAWAAVAARVRARKQGSGGILKLHEDVQTCGYKDVQVMFDMLTSELEAAAQAQKPPPSPPRKQAPPPVWPGWPSSTITAAQ